MIIATDRVKILEGRIPYFGVVVLPAGLLFLRAFFSFVPGVVGLFSAPLLSFLLASGMSVLIWGVEGFETAREGFGCCDKGGC